MAVRGKATPKRVTKANCRIILYYIILHYITLYDIIIYISWATPKRVMEANCNCITCIHCKTHTVKTRTLCMCAYLQRAHGLPTSPPAHRNCGRCNCGARGMSRAHMSPDRETSPGYSTAIAPAIAPQLHRLLHHNCTGYCTAIAPQLHRLLHRTCTGYCTAIASRTHAPEQPQLCNGRAARILYNII